MRMLRYLLLIFLATLLVIDIPLVLLSQSVQQTLLEPDFYLEEFDKYEMYTLAQEQLLAKFPIEGFSAEQLREIVPEEWAREQLQFVLGRHLAFVKGEAPILSCTVELGELRASAKVLATQITSQQYIAQLPQGADLTLSHAIMAQVNVQVSELVDMSIPESINVAYYTDSYAKAVRFYVLPFMDICRYLIYAALALLLSLSVAAWWPPSILRWDGASLALGGIISYAAVTFGLEYAADMILTEMDAMFIAPDMISGLLGDIFAPMRTFSIYLIAIGVLLLAGSFFVHRLPELGEKIGLDLNFLRTEAKAGAKPDASKPEKGAAKPETKEERPKPAPKAAQTKSVPTPAGKGKCPKCGGPIGKNDEFCGECGADIK